MKNRSHIRFLGIGMRSVGVDNPYATDTLYVSRMHKNAYSLPNTNLDHCEAPIETILCYSVTAQGWQSRSGHGWTSYLNRPIHLTGQKIFSSVGPVSGEIISLKWCLVLAANFKLIYNINNVDI